MAGKKIYNDKDSMDINELASLNEDISPELIEQLQVKLMQEAASFEKEDNSSSVSSKPAQSISVDDASLFEEIPVQEPVKENIEPVDNTVAEPQEVIAENTAETDTTTGTATDAATDTVVDNVADETANKEQTESDTTGSESTIEKLKQEKEQGIKKEDVKLDESFDDNFIKKYKAKLNKQSQASFGDGGDNNIAAEPPIPIEEASKGTIKEKAITKEQKEYNDSLDFLDDNVKYSKYVIYISPENVDFIEGLTVKERKNLINNILKQQGDVTLTKQRFKVIQSVINHIIIAIITITISIPVIYTAVNASLEASINNYRRSQANFQVLYKDKGRIKINQN